MSAGENGVEAVQDISTESVTTPPDNLVAQEMQQNEEFALFQKQQNTGKAQPSTSTSTITSISNKIHLQDVTKSSRMTAAAKQCIAMQSAMLSMFEKTQSKMSEDPEDDLDLSFASIAMRMRRNFDAIEKEQLHVEIMNIVNEAIRNKSQGQPVIVPKISIAEHAEKMRQLQVQLQQQSTVPPPPPMQQAPAQNHQLQGMQQGPVIEYQPQEDGTFLALLQSKYSA